MQKLRTALTFARHALLIGGCTGANYFAGAMSGNKSPMRVQIRGTTLLVRPYSPDITVARATLVDDEFAEAIKAAQPLRHNFIVDAGGYIGTASIAFARAFPTARIICLEPAADNFEILKENTKAFPNVIALNRALGHQPGTIKLRNTGMGEWAHTTLDSIIPRQATPMYDVDVTTIPDIMREFGVSGIDILKLDIEGAEKAILAHSSEWMNSVGVITAELHDRLIAGCSDAWATATRTRITLPMQGEKVLCIA